MRYIVLVMRDFENLKSGDKPVPHICNNNHNSSSGDHPGSVVLESSAKVETKLWLLNWQKIQEPLTQDNHNY